MTKLNVKSVNTLGKKRVVIHTHIFVMTVGGTKKKVFTIKKTYLSFGKENYQRRR